MTRDQEHDSKPTTRLRQRTQIQQRESKNGNCKGTKGDGTTEEHDGQNIFVGQIFPTWSIPGYEYDVIGYKIQKSLHRDTQI